MSNAQDRRERKLEIMLQSRRCEPASPDLVERIVRKAQQVPQNQTISLAQWVRGLFAEFRLPRPAYVLVSTLIFGFVVGFTISQYSTATPPPEADSLVVQSFLYADEDLL
ncbi:MAG: hypothetical protein AB7G75_25245 [Candidatus Binatia bacterium]